LGKLLAIIFVIVFFGFFWYFYDNPVLVPSILGIEKLFPQTMIESFDENPISLQFEKGLKTLTKDFEHEFDPTVLENQIHELTNKQREFYNLDTLENDSKLGNVARGHSTDMKNRNYFAHVTPEGLNPTNRGEKLDYSCTKFYGFYLTYGIAENIAKYWTFTNYFIRGNYLSYNWHTEASLANEIVEGWMNSPGHRKNILAPDFEKLGVGVSIGDDGAVYATQNFC